MIFLSGYFITVAEMKIIRGFMENVAANKEKPMFDTHQIVGNRESNMLKVIHAHALPTR